MKYSKEHCEAVGRRIEEYDRVIGGKYRNIGLTICGVCDTVNSDNNCAWCLFKRGKTWCGSLDFNTPDMASVIARRNFLVDIVEKNGYEIVEVDDD